MKNIRFSSGQKLSEILIANPQLILMLPRFNIGLGFGDKKVAEVCEQYGVSTELFLLICNLYTYESYEIDESMLQNINPKELVSYLASSHDYYINSRVSHIARHLDKIVAECGQTGHALSKFFSEYAQEVKYHFHYEETRVFPYIMRISDGAKANYTNETCEKHHANIQDKLSDLTNIIVKYLPADVMPQERISVWFDIVQLSADLEKHTKVEERILMPYIKLMQAKR